MRINLTLKRFQHPYVDGHQSIERETEISYNEGLVPEEVDFPTVAENILNEVPDHMNNLKIVSYPQKIFVSDLDIQVLRLIGLLFWTYFRELTVKIVTSPMNS